VIQRIIEMAILYSKDQWMVLHTQIFIQLIIMFMEDGTIKFGTVLYKMVHNIDFIDILEKLQDHVL
jgi:hypothetical protein